MANFFLGEIIMFAGTFPPVGFSTCNGQLLNISEYNSLYALLGTTYGGDGQNTFGVPDLRGRVPVGVGTLTGGGNYTFGMKGGAEQVTVNVQQLPRHNHVWNVANTAGDTSVPVSGVWLSSMGPSGNTQTNIYAPDDPNNLVTLAGGSISSAGNSQPHANIQPSVGINFVICNSGIFPPRS